jgi:uncharacterized protein (DUF433 family)
MTSDVLNGSPRLDGRRLAVGDIVSGVDINKSLSEYLQDFELSMAQIKECLDYCRTKQCLADSPHKFCHNCTLRVQQDNNTIDDEQDNWLRAEKLFQKHFFA